MSASRCCTPGHTPEHISLLIYDRAMSADSPALLRPAGRWPGPPGPAGRARTGAPGRRSLLRDDPDQAAITVGSRAGVPDPRGGSLCGGNIGSRLSTAVGYERRSNPILAEIDSTENFVDECLRLDNLPVVPPYWRRMRAQNLHGVAPLGWLCGGIIAWRTAAQPVATTPQITVDCPFRLNLAKRRAADVRFAKCPRMSDGQCARTYLADSMTRHVRVRRRSVSCVVSCQLQHWHPPSSPSFRHLVRQLPPNSATLPRTRHRRPQAAPGPRRGQAAGRAPTQRVEQRPRPPSPCSWLLIKGLLVAWSGMTDAPCCP